MAGLFICGFCLFIFVHFYFRIYIQRFLVTPFVPLKKYLSHFLYGITWYVQYFFMAAGFIFLENYKLSTEKLKLSERQRLITEANFLRAQINPHFLQNTLNFLYAQSLTGNTEKLSEGILLLSEMMRYSLQNQGDSNARVPLHDEIKHLENYIAINQLRFGGELQIVMEKKGDQQGLEIIPLVLLTLLENAFKHGDLQDKKYPLRVRIVTDANNTVKFEVSNKIKDGPGERSTGIGIENTRRRLDTAYPGHYRLETAGAAGFYKATLIIQPVALLKA